MSLQVVNCTDNMPQYHEHDKSKPKITYMRCGLHAIPWLLLSGKHRPFELTCYSPRVLTCDNLIGFLTTLQVPDIFLDEPRAESTSVPQPRP